LDEAKIEPKPLPSAGCFDKCLVGVKNHLKNDDLCGKLPDLGVAVLG
jgi:hypothetical protein